MTGMIDMILRVIRQPRCQPVLSTVARTALPVRLALMPLCAILMLFAPAPVMAADVFTVKGVKVDITAENAVAAREQAFTRARNVAFNALAARLLGEGGMQDFTAPDVSVISAMLQDFEITDERLSAVEYIGTYTFRFDGPQVRRFFNMQGVGYSDVVSRKILVLPFYQSGSRMVLWQGHNPFLEAWGRIDAESGLVPVAVPMGDIRDIGDIGDQQALTYRPDGLRSIIDRYGAGEAIILIATPETAANGDVGLTTAIYRTDRNRPEYTRSITVMPETNQIAESATAQDPTALYDRAVQEIRSVLQQTWREQTRVDPAQEARSIHASAQYSTMQQWVETRNAIRRIDGVGAMKILSVTPKEARIELEFSGEINRLIAALDQQGLMLLPPEAGYAYGGTPPLYTLYLKKYARY